MPRLSLANLIARVYARLDNNQQLYTQAEVIDAINEAYRLTNLTLGYEQGNFPLEIPSLPDRLIYDVPDQLMFPTRVKWENRDLKKISLNEIGQYARGWTKANTVNTGLDVTYWIPLGWWKFCIWPADSLGGSLITVSGLVDPDPLVDLTTVVNWSSDTLTAFDLYAAHVLQLKESAENFQKASMDYTGYQSIIQKKTYITGLKMPRWWISDAKQETGR